MVTIIAVIINHIVWIKPIFTFWSNFGWTYTKIETIQRRLAWPLRKDDTQNREAFHIFRKEKKYLCIKMKSYLLEVYIGF